MVKTYEATVEHAFRSRHAVRLGDGSFERPHQHDWRATATFRSSRLDEPAGVVIDFVKARRALEAVAAELDSSDLNAHAAFADKGSAAERVAEYIAARLTESLGDSRNGVKLYRVAVTEAPGCEAAFYPYGP